LSSGSSAAMPFTFSAALGNARDEFVTVVPFFAFFLNQFARGKTGKTIADCPSSGSHWSKGHVSHLLLLDSFFFFFGENVRTAALMVTAPSLPFLVYVRKKGMCLPSMSFFAPPNFNRSLPRMNRHFLPEFLLGASTASLFRRCGGTLFFPRDFWVSGLTPSLVFFGG